MNIDIRTLAIVLSLANVMQVIALFVQYRVDKTHHGLGWWVLGSASGALGFAFNYLRDNPILGPIAIVANNVLFVIGLALLYVGVLRFMDQRERRGWISALCAVFILVIVYFTYLNDDVVARSVIVSVGLAATSFLTAQALFAHKIHSVTASANFLAVVFLANSGFLAMRVLATLTDAPVDGIFTPTLTQTATYLVTLIISTLWTFGFIILVNQRLNVENREAREHLERIFNTSPDAVLITRLTDGYFVDINDGFTALTGYTRAEVIGKSTLDVNIWKNPADRHRVVTVLNEKGFCDNLEAIFQHKDGRQLTGMMSARLIALQGVTHIISVTRDITERKHTEAELRKARESLEAARMAEMQEDERRRIATELHDRVGQNLTAMGINLNIVRSQVLNTQAAETVPRLDATVKLVEETMEHIRDVTAELRPPVLDDYGLLAAVRWYGQRFAQFTGVMTQVDGEELTPRLPQATEIALFRIVQEALTNVAKHTQAKQVNVRLEAGDGLARMSIADDGAGFDVAASHQSGGRIHWGLMNMQERAAAVGGHLRIESSPGAGTRVLIEVPRLIESRPAPST